MSMFDNIILDEFTMLDEGKQAEDYRARKAKEAEDAASEGNRRYRKNAGGKQTSSSRYNFDNDGTYDAPGDKWTKDNPNRGIKHPIKTAKGRDEDIKRQNKANSMVDDLNKHHVYSSGEKGNKELMRAVDAANRHLRRHPKTESALMLIAGYESEFAY